MSNIDQYGQSGNDFEFIAKNKVTSIGMAHPNMKPSTKTDKKGNAAIKVGMSGSTGAVGVDSARPSASVIDTSITHPSGSWSLGVGNKWDIFVGNGGISMLTGGPHRVYSDYCSIIGDAKASFSSKASVEIKSGKTILINAPEVFIKSAKNVVFNSTIVTTGNFVAVGGGYFGGELYALHITTQRQEGETRESEDLEAYMNPAQSFAVMNGGSLLAMQHLQGSYKYSLIKTQPLPDTPGYVDVIMTLPLPPPIDTIVNIPAKIAFPYGLRLISDGFYGQNGPAATLLWNSPAMPGTGIRQSDTYGGCHTHGYDAPAMKLVDKTSGVMQDCENSKIMEKKPIASKRAEPHGGFKEWTQEYLKNCQKRVTDFGAKLWDKYNPF